MPLIKQKNWHQSYYDSKVLLTWSLANHSKYVLKIILESSYK